jgi:hypothetical protein
MKSTDSIVMRVLGCACCLWIGSTVLYAQSTKQAPANEKLGKDAKAAAVSFLRHLNGDSSFLPSVKGREDVLAEIWRIYSKQSAKVRRNIIPYIPMMGKDFESVDKPRWMTSAAAVKTLIDIFVTDKDVKCRSKAADMLLTQVPDLMIRTHAREIIAAARQYAGGDVDALPENLILLVGKTGSAQAKELLTKWDAAYRKKRKSPHLYVNMALAKLGDTKRERLFIDMFEKTCKPGKKSAVLAVREAAGNAKYLAYIGQPASVMALARQYRNPLHYRAEGSDYSHVMSLRFAIVAAFYHIWPDNELFHFPYSRPVNGEADYIKVEVWLKAHLGVKWDLPRPAFTEEGAQHQLLGW